MVSINNPSNIYHHPLFTPGTRLRHSESSNSESTETEDGLAADSGCDVGTLLRRGVAGRRDGGIARGGARRRGAACTASSGTRARAGRLAGADVLRCLCGESGEGSHGPVA